MARRAETMAEIINMVAGFDNRRILLNEILIGKFNYTMRTVYKTNAS